MTEFITSRKGKVYQALAYLSVLLCAVFPYADKDWGWHYKLGELLLQTGRLPRGNPFTWTLPDYQWTNHEWLFDPILYLLTKAIGFAGLSVAGGVACGLAFYLICSRYQLAFWKIAVAGWFFVRLSEVGILEGFRAQVVSNLLFALLMAILIMGRRAPKQLWALPPLFLLWANLHGTFTLGLGVTLVFLGSDLLAKVLQGEKAIRGHLARLSPVLLTTALVTLLNPHGGKVYLEALKHAANPYLARVMEWQPMADCSYCHLYTFYAYLALLLFILWRRRSARDLPYLALALIFAVPSLLMRRYLPIFAVVTLPLLVSYLEGVKFDLRKHHLAEFLAIAVIWLAITYNLLWRFPGFNLYNYGETDYCQNSSGCSPAMAAYLTEHPLPGRGFNFYNWGGYYIGKGIPEKLFIDGRMHLWTQDGYMPFADYMAIYYEGNDPLFRQYRFAWALVERESELGQKLGGSNALGPWRILFQDGDSVLYGRQ